MVDEHDFPTQLADDLDGGAGALRWTTRVIAATALALALFNAGAIAAWTEDLAPGPASARAVIAAEGWRGTMARIGLDAAYADLHRAWKRLEDVRWPNDRIPGDRP